jgi:hypothetical protein
MQMKNLAVSLTGFRNQKSNGIKLKEDKKLNSFENWENT